MRHFFLSIWMAAAAVTRGSGVLAAHEDGLRTYGSLRRPRLRGVETLMRTRVTRRRPQIQWRDEGTGMVKAPSDPILFSGTSALSRSAASLRVMASERTFVTSPGEFIKVYLNVQRNVVKGLLGSDEGNVRPEERSLVLAFSALTEAHLVMPSELPGAPPEDPNTAEVVRSVVQACTYFWQLAELTWPDIFKRKDASAPSSPYRLRLKSPGDFLRAVRVSTRSVLCEKVLSKLRKAIDKFSNASWDRADIDFLAYELKAVWGAYEQPTAGSLDALQFPE